MPKSHMKFDIGAIAPLHRLAKICAILPSFNANYEFRSSYIHAIIAGVLTVTITAISFYGNTTIFSQHLETTVLLTSIASDVSLTLATLASIIGINVLHGKDVCKFLRALRDIDTEFAACKRDAKYPKFRFYCEILICHALFAIYYGYNVYIWGSSVGFEVFKYFIPRDVQYYHVVILSLLLRTYARVIRYRLQILNELLLGIGTKLHDANKVVTIGTDPVWEVRKMMRVFTNLAQIIGGFNDVFGWQLVTIYVWILCNILMSINMMLVYGGGGHSFMGIYFGVDMYILCTIWTLIPIVIIVALAQACDRGSAETTNTGDICYQLIHTLPNTNENKELIAELWNFASQTTSRCPKFSCGEFYVVNYSVCFSLVGVVTSYVIVLIQFHK